jgi:hypothetical protein
LLPKLIKGEDIYTINVIKLLQQCPELLKSFVEVAHPSVAIKVIERASQDVR